MPQYRLLNGEQIRSIHEATIRLLETTGVKVLSDEAVRMLTDCGCRLKPGGIVQIPGELVLKCMASAPSSVTVYHRSGDVAMRLEGRRVHFGMGTDLTHTYDLDSGELRPSRLQDVINAARIADRLDEIDFIGSYALPFDSPPAIAYIDAFKVQLENSSKPIFFTAAGSGDLEIIQQMAASVVGGEKRLREKPIHIHYSEPLSPLTHTQSGIEKLFFCADHAIPITYTPGMMAGASAPVTLAGAVTMGNAEALSGLVLHQLRCPGAPIISGFGMSTFDMKSAACIYGCPEYRLALSACADLYHHYGLPMWGTAGVSDSHVLDQQAGMEWSVSLLSAAMDGANLVHDVGYLGQGLIGHPAALVMCAEIISYVKRWQHGFGLSPEDIALDLIDQVGPQGGFLATSHTLKHFRREHWQPRTCNRKLMDAWRAEGETTWAERATLKARAILGEKNRRPLPDDTLARLDEIRAAAL